MLVQTQTSQPRAGKAINAHSNDESGDFARLLEPELTASAEGDKNKPPEETDTSDVVTVSVVMANADHTREMTVRQGGNTLPQATESTSEQQARALAAGGDKATTDANAERQSAAGKMAKDAMQLLATNSAELTAQGANTNVASGGNTGISAPAQSGLRGESVIVMLDEASASTEESERQIQAENGLETPEWLEQIEHGRRWSQSSSSSAPEFMTGGQAATPEAGLVMAARESAPLMATPERAPLLDRALTLHGSPEQNAKQLAQQAQVVVNQNLQEADIRLNPSELGGLKIQIKMERGEVQVQFVASNPQARELIEQAMPRLREMLNQQGMNLGQGQGQGQGQQGQQQGQQQEQSLLSGQQQNPNQAASQEQQPRQQGGEVASESEQGYSVTQGGTVTLADGALARPARLDAGRIDFFA